MSSEKWAEELADSQAGHGNDVFSPAGATGENGPDVDWQALTDVAPKAWKLRLYVCGDSTKSLVAFANLKRLCEAYLPGRHEVEIVDLVEYPSLAQDAGIVAVPTLVRLAPLPTRTIIGDLSDIDEVLTGLQIRAKQL